MPLILLVLISLSSYAFEREPEEKYLPPKDQSCRAFANKFLQMQLLGDLDNPSGNVAETYIRPENRNTSHPSFAFTSNSGHLFRGQEFQTADFSEPGYKVSIYKPLSKRERKRQQASGHETGPNEAIAEYVFKMKAGKCVLVSINDFTDDPGIARSYDANACKLIRKKNPPTSQKYRMCRAEYMGFFYSNPDDDLMKPDFSRVSKNQFDKNGKSQRNVK